MSSEKLSVKRSMTAVEVVPWAGRVFPVICGGVVLATSMLSTYCDSSPDVPLTADTRA